MKTYHVHVGDLFFIVNANGYHYDPPTSLHFYSDKGSVAVFTKFDAVFEKGNVEIKS